jgi:hypothetical protein
MPIHRLDHAVLYVRDLERSVAFYYVAEHSLRLPRSY